MDFYPRNVNPFPFKAKQIPWFSNTEFWCKELFHCGKYFNFTAR